MPHAIRIHKTGGPEVLQVERVAAELLLEAEGGVDAAETSAEDEHAASGRAGVV